MAAFSAQRKVQLLTPTPRAALALQSTFPRLFVSEESTEVTGFENGVRISQHGMPKI